MDENVEDLLDVSQLFGIKAYHNRSPRMWILMICIWIDFLYESYVLFNPHDRDNCLFIDIGCLSPIENYFCFNLAWLFFRFTMYSMMFDWFHDDQRWLRNVSYFYDEMKQNQIKVNIWKVRQQYHRPYRIVLIMIIIYNLIIFNLLKFRSLIETIVLHLEMTFIAYLIGFFFIENFLLKKFCILLFIEYQTRLIENINSERFDRNLIKTFYRYYLLITYAKIYLKKFYILASIFLFGVCLCLYYIAFHTKINPFERFCYATIWLTIFLFLIYISGSLGKIDSYANNLSKSIYHFVNIESIRKNIFKQHQYKDIVVEVIQIVNC